MFNLKIRQWYWMPITVFFLGLLSIMMLLWINRISERERFNFDLCDALMDIQIKTISFHLRFEELIRRDTVVDFRMAGEVWDEIDIAISLAEAVLESGLSEHGQPLQPLKDSKLRQRVEDIKELLTEFRMIALERVETPKVADAGLFRNQRFHAVFEEIRSKAGALENDLEWNQIGAQARARSLFFGVLVTWILVLVSATIGFWNREVRRRTAAKALQKANEQLEFQTEELRKYQEHLTTLVEERTSDLTAANRYLQQEISERKEAEKSLRSSENKFRTLVENLPQRICLKDKNSVYLYCNENYAQDLNVRPDEIAGKTDYDFYPKELAERHFAEDNKILNSGKTEWIEERCVKNGDEVVIQKIKLPVKNEKGEMSGILDIFWDITERIRLESIAEAVTTMNNIGYIFAGIRHEIGNPINSAKMTLSVLQKKIDTYSKEAIQEYLERALGEISSVEYLLKTLKSFNMYETPQVQNVEMKPFMDKFLSLLSDDFMKRGIAIEIFFEPEAQWGYADPRALQQVMLNIMSNASDAVDGRDSPRILIKMSRVDSNIRIKVTDNGCGISEEQQKRLFTPFFTTKASGTGLGLVIAKKLLSRMNGILEIKSRRDEGTSVVISIWEGRDER